MRLAKYIARIGEVRSENGKTASEGDQGKPPIAVLDAREIWKSTATAQGKPPTAT